MRGRLLDGIEKGETVKRMDEEGLADDVARLVRLERPDKMPTRVWIESALLVKRFVAVLSEIRDAAGYCLSDDGRLDRLAHGDDSHVPWIPAAVLAYACDILTGAFPALLQTHDSSFRIANAPWRPVTPASARYE